MDSFVGKIVTEFPQVSMVNVQAQIKTKILKDDFQSWHSQPLRKLVQLNHLYVILCHIKWTLLQIMYNMISKLKIFEVTIFFL